MTDLSREPTSLSLRASEFFNEQRDKIFHRTDRMFAWLMIGQWIFGIALAPGFMNAFQTASLLLRPRRRYFLPDQYPPLTLLIAAYNEAPGIAQTLRSIQAQRYAGALELIVIDDGSTDGTADVVRAIGDPRIRLLVQPRNTGKASALNFSHEKWGRATAPKMHSSITAITVSTSSNPADSFTPQMFTSVKATYAATATPRMGMSGAAWLM